MDELSTKLNNFNTMLLDTLRFAGNKMEGEFDRRMFRENYFDPILAQFRDLKTDLMDYDFSGKPVFIDQEEPDDRTSLLSIKHHNLHSFVFKQLSTYWYQNDAEISESNIRAWNEMPETEKYPVKLSLGFFLVSDHIVGKNLTQFALPRVQNLESQEFLAIQGGIEAIHSIVYRNLFKRLIPAEEHEKFQLKSCPVVNAKARWAQKWISPDTPLSVNIFAFMLVEGIFFSVPFSIIFWLRSRNKMPDLVSANQLIARDENLHTEFAKAFYLERCKPLDLVVMTQMIAEVVEIECMFAHEAMKHGPLHGLTADLLCDYAKFVADKIAVGVEMEPIYKVKNPFPFMDQAGSINKTSFLEVAPIEYERCTTKEKENLNTIEFDDEF